MKRRTLLGLSLSVPLLTLPSLSRAAAPRLEVARSPTCGCCGLWVDHMRAAGFDARVHEMETGPLHALKQRLGLHPDLWSCHTALIDGYAIEGHVPAADVQRLLEQRPDVLGLAVPGMPVGSPGMETAGPAEPFDTLLIALDGTTTVFSEHR